MTYAMSRRERLERWAVVVERAAGTKLSPLLDVEFVPALERPALRAASSPLAIAYDDPVLRRAGLESDRLGDGRAFFELSPGQAHRVLCSCGYLGMMQASEVARRIRVIAARERLREAVRGLWGANPLPAFGRRLVDWVMPARQHG